MNAVLHPNQSAVAKELGIDAAASAEDVIDAIEIKLGEASMELRARWFVVSVLRHLSKAKWVGLDDCAVDEKRQRELARDCLAIKGFATSLGTVTKDSRSKYRFVGFASSKNIERGMLATGTKAYKIAVSVVCESGLVEGQVEAANKQSKSEPKVNPKPKSELRAKSKAKPETTTGSKPKQEPKRSPKPAELEAAEKSVVARRAKRRGYADDELRPATGTEEARSSKSQAVAMSKEEFASLDAALSKDDAEIVQQNWMDQSNEDRWSRILGILAGVGFFVFIALLFL